MKKRKLLVVTILLAVGIPVCGQPTYNHDAPVYNQFLVGETGAGSLQPELYYSTTHRSYKSWAYYSNKNALRVDMTLALEKEKPLAEQIDSALTYRAKIEAMNVADRTPKALDLAWQSERTKIEKKFQLFRENINKITMNGGTSQDYKEWIEIYNCLQTALKAVRDAYMPLNERKKQYLEIYHDIVRRNSQLVQYIYSLSYGKQVSDLLHSEVSQKHPKIEGLTTEAYGRWKVSLAAGLIKTNNK